MQREIGFFFRRHHISEGQNAEIRKREEAARLERAKRKQQEEEQRHARQAAQLHVLVCSQLKQIGRTLVSLKAFEHRQPLDAITRNPTTFPRAPKSVKDDIIVERA